MNELQAQINDLVQGKHRQWHVEAQKTKEYDGNSYSGWDYVQSHWEFVVGFDTYGDALDAMRQMENLVREGEPYGGTQYEFRISERVGA